ncbi:Crp/Fnr family transcriptional regulator [candidate division KSB1 bacterium]|nr:Crp/Fnr family transcriptional regulator [candidate division KSB1 bacterium]
MIEYELKRAFDKYFDAPIAVWKTFAEACDIVKFRKNEIIKRAGEIERNGYFLLEGACGVFLWKENNYVCIDLVLEKDFFGDNMSLITGQPSPLETIALEKTRALRLSRGKYDQLKKTPIGSIIFLIAAENSFVEKQKQQIDLLLKTAEQRYAELLNNQPQIVQRIAQKHIASYLGITAQSLSRIRRNL